MLVVGEQDAFEIVPDEDDRPEAAELEACLDFDMCFEPVMLDLDVVFFVIELLDEVDFLEVISELAIRLECRLDVDSLVALEPRSDVTWLEICECDVVSDKEETCTVVLVCCFVEVVGL